jgi:hypothetical protein
MSFSLNIHRVTNIVIGPVSESRGESTVYVSRTIEITTPEGVFEISLYSTQSSLDGDKELLRVQA